MYGTLPFLLSSPCIFFLLFFLLSHLLFPIFSFTCLLVFAYIFPFFVIYGLGLLVVTCSPFSISAPQCDTYFYLPLFFSEFPYLFWNVMSIFFHVLLACSIFYSFLFCLVIAWTVANEMLVLFLNIFFILFHRIFSSSPQ
jgi:hypothetical protein